MAGVGWAVRYDDWSAMAWRMPPSSPVRKALALALTVKHEALQGAGRSWASCLISSYLPETG